MTTQDHHRGREIGIEGHVASPPKKRKRPPLPSPLPPSPEASGVKEKRVVEYLVFEKRFWYDDPWVIKEQVWAEGGTGRWD
jgi:hypothetical protein